MPCSPIVGICSECHVCEASSVESAIRAQHLRSANAVQVLKMIDEYDLYGSVAYPKAHSQVRCHVLDCLARVCLARVLAGTTLAWQL